MSVSLEKTMFEADTGDGCVLGIMYWPVESGAVLLLRTPRKDPLVPPPRRSRPD